MRLSSIAIYLVSFAVAVMAVPEIEHDLSDIDQKDCKVFTKQACVRECPHGYVGIERGSCSAAEDEHECCEVRCCRSRHQKEHEHGHNA